MMRLFRSLLDILLPHKERVARTHTYTLNDLALSPVSHPAGAQSITTLMSYRTRAVEDLIRALKYDGSEHAANILAEALAEYLREEIASLKAFSTRNILLVPVPLHKSRERERGFNQVELVLRHLPAEFRNGTHARIASALARVRATKQQTKLSQRERLVNVKNAFALVKPDTLRNAHLILIDDVTTTGATLSEAARPLLAAGGVVTLLALARA